MPDKDFEQSSSGFPEMSETEKLAVREQFFATITDAIRRDAPYTPDGTGMVQLNTSLGNQESIIITVSNFRNEQSPTGSITLNRITGNRRGDTSVYEPDEITGYIIRRDLTLQDRRDIAAKLLGLLDDEPDQDDRSRLDQPVQDIVDDYTKVETSPGSSRRELPLVWPEEMQWLSEVVQHAGPRR